MFLLIPNDAHYFLLLEVSVRPSRSEHVFVSSYLTRSKHVSVLLDKKRACVCGLSLDKKQACLCGLLLAFTCLVCAAVMAPTRKKGCLACSLLHSHVWFLEPSVHPTIASHALACFRWCCIFTGMSLLIRTTLMCAGGTAYRFRRENRL